MCKNLIEKGPINKPLILYNRTVQRALDLNKSLPPGTSMVASSIEVIIPQVDIIFTCVGDDAAIRETIDTALKANVIGKLFVDCSTVHPETTDEIAKKIMDAGGEFVACPVFGAPAAVSISLLTPYLLTKKLPRQTPAS